MVFGHVALPHPADGLVRRNPFCATKCERTACKEAQNGTAARPTISIVLLQMTFGVLTGWANTFRLVPQVQLASLIRIGTEVLRR
jgi:hypothetical protein